MCLLVLSIDQHPVFDFVFAGNRDEFFSRPTLPAHPWEEETCPGEILAGKDLKDGGTWLGITRSGRFAAITNYRSPEKRSARHGARSRGLIVSEFLRSSISFEQYVERLSPEAGAYNDFSLVAGELGRRREITDGRTRFGYLSSFARELTELSPGLYALSNSGLDVPWFKVKRAKTAITDILNRTKNVAPAEDILALLMDATKAPDEELPDTGIGFESEKRLSSVFIEGQSYGTRSSTVIVKSREGEVLFVERTHAPSERGKPPVFTDRTFEFVLNE